MAPPDGLMGQSLLPGLKRAEGRSTWSWDPVDGKDARCETGCGAVAAEISRLLGGDRCLIRPKSPAPMLGAFRGKHWQWTYHVVVIKDALVYDITTGSDGVEMDIYKSFWEYADYIDFGF